MDFTTMQFHELMDLEIDQLDEQELQKFLVRLQELKRKDYGQVAEDSALGRPEYRGYVYILSNISMPGLVKIGFTETLAETRAKFLSAHSGIPTPFRVEWKCAVYIHPKRAEEAAHKSVESFRLRPNREFFRLSVEDAKQFVLKAITEFDSIVAEKPHPGL